MNKRECIVVLKKQRERPLLQGSPWIFLRAVKNIYHYQKAGDLCTVQTEGGKFLAKGYVNANSNIAVRILTLRNGAIDRAFVSKAINRALSLRERYFLTISNAYRIVNSEGDFFPGLIVDKYNRGIVFQALTAGIQRLKGLIIDELIRIFNPEFLYEKSATPASSLEGVEISNDLVYGKISSPLIIEENNLKFYVDIFYGQKTGFFLDQRKNRSLLSSLSHEREVLNCFSYTGAFGVYAHRGGAKRVVNIDISERALEGARENALLNRMDSGSFEVLKEDVFAFLRKTDRLYDVIVVDPPKFAGSRAELKGAVRGYKDINMHAMKRMRDGGFLFTFSCSSAVTPRLFQEIVSGAAFDAGRKIQILLKLHADVDHPVNLTHTEGEYLKGFCLRVF